MNLSTVTATLILFAAGSTFAFAEISRDHVNRTGTTERLHEDPPSDIADRAEAIIDAIWNQDFESFFDAAVAPESREPGYVARDEEHFQEILDEFRVFYRGDLRTMRHPPKWPTPEAERVWVRVSVQRLNSSTVRGQFILIFDAETWALERVTLNRYHHADLPAPEPEYPDDIIRDRPAAQDKS